MSRLWVFCKHCDVRWATATEEGPGRCMFCTRVGEVSELQGCRTSAPFEMHFVDGETQEYPI